MNQQIKKILDTVPFGGLATVGENGVPSVVPLHFAANDENIYWFSLASADHSRNLRKNHQASFAVWTDDRLPDVAGVYLQTWARRLHGSEIAAAKKAFAKKFGEVPAAFADMTMYGAEIGQIDAAKTNGRKWYMKSNGGEK